MEKSDEILKFRSKNNGQESAANYYIIEPLVNFMVENKEFSEVIFSVLDYFKIPESDFLWSENKEIFETFIESSDLSVMLIEKYKNRLNELLLPVFGLNPNEYSDFRGDFLEEYWNEIINRKYDNKVEIIREVIVCTETSDISIVKEVDSDLDFLYFQDDVKNELKFIECKADIVNFFQKATREDRNSLKSLKKMLLANNLIDEMNKRNIYSSLLVSIAGYNLIDDIKYQLIEDNLNKIIERDDIDLFRTSIIEFKKKWHDGFISMYDSQKTFDFLD